MTSLLLGDLNDYISPSTECVKPVQDFKVNLNDCLACSGCITSAESVLVTEQTRGQVYEAIEAGKRVVISISPATRFALCKHYNLTFGQVWVNLQNFLVNTLKAHSIVDTGLGNFIALEAAYREFEQRTGTIYTSECPGWVCYAEKKQTHLLPFISKVKSPQQIMGTLVKMRGEEETVFHVSVQPCFDKKLEASRQDFIRDGIKDVDCVISTMELVEMITEKGYEYLMDENPEHRFPGKNASGGYLDYILRRTAKEVFHVDLASSEEQSEHLQVKQLKKDYVEYVLCDKLHFATIYGFRNIQTFLQRAKRNKVRYDYVEVMACPGACLFGGGQPKVTDQDTYRTRMEDLFNSTPVDPHYETFQMPFHIKDLLNGLPDVNLLYTSYKPLSESSNKSLTFTVNW